MRQTTEQSGKDKVKIAQLKPLLTRVKVHIPKAASLRTVITGFIPQGK